MKLALFAYSRQGIATARKISELFPDAECDLLVPERLQEPGLTPVSKPSAACYAEKFAWADCMIFVGSCGIAVRQIAPCVRDKMTDPAVLCVDELGRFAIALLSGHVGGANELAAFVADGIGAIPVITTATDINGRFSVDAWAVRSGFVFDSRRLAKEISAAVLEGAVPVCSEYPINDTLPAGLRAGDEGTLGIYIGHTRRDPFDRTLHIIPKCLHVGIGCRRGTPEERIRAAVDQVFTEHSLNRRAIACVSSIDLKADEQGLLSYCTQEKLPLSFYTAGQLRSVAGEFASSSFVNDITGVDNVCERSAMIGAERILVKKTIVSGVTVAVAAEKVEIRFG